MQRASSPIEEGGGGGAEQALARSHTKADGDGYRYKIIDMSARAGEIEGQGRQGSDWVRWIRRKAVSHAGKGRADGSESESESEVRAPLRTLLQLADSLFTSERVTI